MMMKVVVMLFICTAFSFPLRSNEDLNREGKKHMMMLQKRMKHLQDAKEMIKKTKERAMTIKLGRRLPKKGGTAAELKKTVQSLIEAGNINKEFFDQLLALLAEMHETNKEAETLCVQEVEVLKVNQGEHINGMGALERLKQAVPGDYCGAGVIDDFIASQTGSWSTSQAKIDENCTSHRQEAEELTQVGDLINSLGRCADVTCPAATQCHEEGTCDNNDGSCIDAFKQAGTPCDDGDVTTLDDVCDQQGGCSGTLDLCYDVTCPALTQCHDEGTCEQDQGSCILNFKADDFVCDDGDGTTENDMCDGMGGCSGTKRLETNQLYNKVSTTDPMSDDDIKDMEERITAETAAETGYSENDIDVKVTAMGTGQRRLLSFDYGLVTTFFNVVAATDPQLAATLENAIKTEFPEATVEAWDPCADVTCPAQSDCHEVGICSGGTGTGVCSDVFKASGTSCDDADSLTVDDVCDGAGACAGVDPCADMTCEFIKSDCHDVGHCDMGNCVHPFKASGASCDDGDSITLNDVCDGAGVCAGVDPCDAMTCPAQSDCHDVGTCTSTPSGGVCSDAFKASGTSCDDADFNTVDDVCDGAGACAGVDPCADVTCPAQSDCHDVGTCDFGICVDAFKASGTSCDDADPITEDDVCDGAGVCAGLVPPTCDDGIQNQDETDVDCGGDYSGCPKCEDWKERKGYCTKDPYGLKSLNRGGYGKYWQPVGKDPSGGESTKEKILERCKQQCIHSLTSDTDDRGTDKKCTGIAFQPLPNPDVLGNYSSIWTYPHFWCFYLNDDLKSEVGFTNDVEECKKTMKNFTEMQYDEVRTFYDLNVDPQECKVDNGGCHEKAHCLLAPGGRTCECIGGYVGDGLSCTANWNKSPVQNCLCTGEINLNEADGNNGSASVDACGKRCDWEGACKSFGFWSSKKRCSLFTEWCGSSCYNAVTGSNAIYELKMGWTLRENKRCGVNKDVKKYSTTISGGSKGRAFHTDWGTWYDEAPVGDWAKCATAGSRHNRQPVELSKYGWYHRDWLKIGGDYDNGSPLDNPDGTCFQAETSLSIGTYNSACRCCDYGMEPTSEGWDKEYESCYIDADLGRIRTYYENGTVKDPGTPYNHECDNKRREKYVVLEYGALEAPGQGGGANPRCKGWIKQFPDGCETWTYNKGHEMWAINFDYKNKQAQNKDTCCNNDCEEWGCDCQTCSDKFQVDSQTIVTKFGSSNPKLVEWWNAQKCDNDPRDLKTLALEALVGKNCAQQTTEESCLAGMDNRRTSHSYDPCDWCCGDACNVQGAQKCHAHSEVIESPGYTYSKNAVDFDTCPVCEDGYSSGWTTEHTTRGFGVGELVDACDENVECNTMRKCSKLCSDAGATYYNWGGKGNQTLNQAFCRCYSEAQRNALTLTGSGWKMCKTELPANPKSQVPPFQMKCNDFFPYGGHKCPVGARTVTYAEFKSCPTGPVGTGGGACGNLGQYWNGTYHVRGGEVTGWALGGGKCSAKVVTQASKHNKLCVCTGFFLGPHGGGKCPDGSKEASLTEFQNCNFKESMCRADNGEYQLKGGFATGRANNYMGCLATEYGSRVPTPKIRKICYQIKGLEYYPGGFGDGQYQAGPYEQGKYGSDSFY